MNASDYKEFNLEEYEAKVKNIKLKRFIEYLKIHLGMNYRNSKIILVGITKVDIIKSLDYYINKNKVGYQITALNYITYITKFFDELSCNFNIKNELFLNKELYNDMQKDVKVIISKLNKSKFEIADTEDIDKLKNHINVEINEINKFDLIDEIMTRTIENNKYTGKYNNFMSIIPTKLALEYGIKNEYLCGIKIDDYNEVSNRLKVGLLEIPLSEEYKHLFDTYLELRSLLVKKYGIQYQDLFLKGTGEPINNDNGVPDTSALFFVMKKAMKKTGALEFVYSKILEYIDMGIDIFVISKFTGIQVNKCIELLEYYHGDIVKTDFQKMFESQHSISQKRNIEESNTNKYLRCPSCNAYVKPNIDNWIAVKYESDENMYIVCKECKGEIGKDYL